MVAVCGNKLDLADRRVVSQEEVVQFVNSHSDVKLFMETSARVGASSPSSPHPLCRQERTWRVFSTAWPGSVRHRGSSSLWSISRKIHPVKLGAVGYSQDDHIV